jgi:hypothetical protein
MLNLEKLSIITLAACSTVLSMGSIDAAFAERVSGSNYH